MAVIGYILTNVSPSTDIFRVGPINYWPIIGLFFLASFCLTGFLTLSTRRGLLVSSVLSWLLLMKLQSIEISWPQILFAFLLVCLTEASLIFLKKLSRT
jgi:hypothetical protein